MKRYKLTIAYDGTLYKGWQRQREPALTVQREIEKAAGYIVSHPVIVQGSSRTDTGVHARGQVAAFNTESPLTTDILRKAINSRLPADIFIRRLEEVSLDFDVRRAVRKQYRYMIWAAKDRPLFQRNYVYHFYRPLNLELMQRACGFFVGAHDFESFKGQSDVRDNTTRTIFRCDIRFMAIENRKLKIENRHAASSRPLVVFTVEGSGFLYHMVRTMVGTLLDVGTGKYPPERVAEIIAGKDRQLAGPVVPAQGLCLQWIRFAD